MSKTYKIGKRIETRYVTGTGRSLKTTTYTLMKKDSEFKAATLYNLDGPFVIVYRNYDDEGKQESKTVSVVCDVGYNLVVLKPAVKEVVEILQGMRATLASQED